MSEPIAYLNGRWLPQSQATLPLNDAGFVLGATVVDFVRTFNHVLGDWPRHLERFQDGVKEACFWNWNHSDRELTDLAEELVRQNAALIPQDQDLAMIVFATPGRLGYYLGDPEVVGEGAPTLGMHTFPLPMERYRGMIQYGARLRVSNLVEAPPLTWVPPGVKHRSRMHWWLAEQDAHTMDSGASRALLLNEAGHITETSFANVLLVKGKRIISPKHDTILPGISLQTVRELCPALGLTFDERDLTLKNCLTADEMLLCGTAFCLASVRQLNETTFPANGETMSRLIEAWSTRVGMDIHGQILG